MTEEAVDAAPPSGWSAEAGGEGAAAEGEEEEDDDDDDDLPPLERNTNHRAARAYVESSDSEEAERETRAGAEGPAGADETR